MGGGQQEAELGVGQQNGQKMEAAAAAAAAAVRRRWQERRDLGSDGLKG